MSILLSIDPLIFPSTLLSVVLQLIRLAVQMYLGNGTYNLDTIYISIYPPIPVYLLY